MAWGTTKGFNFRSTLAFVTDGTNEQAVLGEQYPQTTTIGGDSVVWGWDSNMELRNRNSTNDRRLAGNTFIAAGTVDAIFRVDLPATGEYKLRLSLGDATYSALQWCDVRDNTTVLYNVGGGTITTAANSFLDANAVERTAANWPGSNTQKQSTFSSTILRVVVRAVASAVQGRITHLEIEQVIAAANPAYQPWYHRAPVLAQ